MSDSDNTPTKSPAAKRKLGKGLGALMGEARREEPLVARRPAAGSDSVEQTNGTAALDGQPRNAGLATLSVADIEPHPDQPRRHFDEESLAELAASIASRGVIQPVIVRPMGRGKYQLVAGERRWRASQRAQLHEIPALIRDLEDREVMALALIENIQREDLNPIEEARAYQRLSEEEDMTQAEIATLVEKSRSHVANLQRLLSLPSKVLDFLEAGKLDMGHGRALIGLDAAEDIAEQAVAKNLSVREVEKLARKSRNGGESPARRQARPSRDPAQDADIAAVENHLEEFLGLPVKIATDTDPRSGAVTVRFRTLDQLDLICQRLTGGGI
ncbi:chromosome partitioning protein ParB [Aurantiacibacter atlanticus]|uniref:Chromosome partitioning protein ParB n=1 Tax=Aurantiacibacter atlanticus TaxID=1648404 RepID=A0A0H4VVN9_9SPHN|nr:ParB/RepB/Spo0J family partition protein [Aurantiacibacter atlanticus]AKQ41108.1 chromosome partitioning protein ParB [Aurantiacibacter atlanticus]MDF1833464.1 ParB/RepB/Spo0J family partition protein [Alteraurantiacibacter sp. bin_em_oilr2.035]